MIETQILNPKPMFHQLELLGSLAYQEHVVDGLHIFVEYRKAKEGPIYGCVLGDNSTAKKLLTLVDRARGYYKLEARMVRNRNCLVCSEHVRIRSATEWVAVSQGDTDRVSHRISELEFDDIKIQEAITGEREKAIISFSIRGARDFWPAYFIGKPSYTGNLKTEQHPVSLNLNGFSEVRVEFDFIYEDHKLAGTSGVFTSHFLVLNFCSATNANQVEATQFSQKCESIADDLLLLASVASRRWLRWDRYTLTTKDIVIRYIRSIPPVNTQKIWQGDLLIMPSDCARFLEDSVSAYRELQKQGMDLRLPLVYLISGHEQRTIDPQFTSYFLALEKIKDMYASGQKGFIVGRGIFDKISDIVRKRIDEITDNLMIPDELKGKVRDELKEKVSELRRRPMKKILSEMFQDYGVSWHDLYPDGHKFTIVDTRHKLFHSSEEVKIDTLVRETLRLRYLVERVVLAMLKWSGHSTAQWPIDRRFLQSED